MSIPIVNILEVRKKNKDMKSPKNAKKNISKNACGNTGNRENRCDRNVTVLVSHMYKCKVFKVHTYEHASFGINMHVYACT